MIEPPSLGPLAFAKDVMDEGDFAQLSCIATSGDEPLSLSWTFHGDSPEKISGSHNGISTTNLGPRMSILVIQSIGHHHQGKYTCQAKNRAGIQSQSAELKVNGNL